MNDPKNTTDNNADDCPEGSIDCAEKKLHTSISQEHPEWVDDNGECDSCVSLEHEMAADPTQVPKDV